MERECECDETNICSDHFWERYKETPQYYQQYGGPKNTSGIGWAGNGLGVVRIRYDEDED